MTQRPAQATEALSGKLRDPTARTPSIAMSFQLVLAISINSGI